MNDDGGYRLVYRIKSWFGSSLGRFRVKKFRPSQPRGEISELFLDKNKEKVLKTEVFRTFCGGDKRDRTADLLNAIQALSQLSYTPMFHSSVPQRHLTALTLQHSLRICQGGIFGNFMYFATKITEKKIEETACFCRFRRIETGEKLVSLTSKVKNGIIFHMRKTLSIKI